PVGGGVRRGVPAGEREGLSAVSDILDRGRLTTRGETLADTDTVQTLTDSNWETDVMASPQPVLVDFWAEWCAPCKTLLPAVQAVADQFKGRLRVGKVNVEENEQVPFRYNITTLPTLMIIKAGKVSEQRVGLISRENLVK